MRYLAILALLVLAGCGDADYRIRPLIVMQTPMILERVPLGGYVRPTPTSPPPPIESVPLGIESWQTKIGNDMRPVGYVASTSRVYVARYHGISALDARTGKAVWQRMSDAVPVAASDSAVYVFEENPDHDKQPFPRDGYLSRLDVRDGHHLWRKHFDSGYVSADDAGFVLVSDGFVEAYDGSGLTGRSSSAKRRAMVR